MKKQALFKRLALTATLALSSFSGAAFAQDKVGDKMPDGTIYAGTSRETHWPMYTTPADAPRTMTHDEARSYAENQNTHSAHGHKDWGLPTQAELKLLFNNRASIGGFDSSGGSEPANFFYTRRGSEDLPGWYWSSNSSRDILADGMRFDDGAYYTTADFDHLSVRLVRSHKEGTTPEPFEIAALTDMAKTGDVFAQNQLGALYVNGEGVAQDYTKAAKWYRAAAEQGNPSAQIRLGRLYERARGLKQDYAEAYFWYRLAASQGYAQSRQDADEVAKDCTPAQIAAVNKRVEQWKPTSGTPPKPPAATKLN